MGLGSVIRNWIGRPRGEYCSDLSWIDEFIQNVRPYVFVRIEDNLLIKLPNQVQKLNPEGALILSALLQGQSIHTLLNRLGRDPRKVRDVTLFIFEVKRFLEGQLNEFNRTRAVELQPFDMRFAKLPVLSEIAVTYRCNLRCSFCYAGCNCTSNPVGDEQEMTSAQVKQVLEKLYLDGRVPSVSFTGGEATVRRDLPELVHFAANLGMRVNLITNGTLVTQALAERLASAGLASAQVSLEGVTARTHETLTRIPGSFQKAVAGFHRLRSAGIRVHTNTTINRQNLAECTRIPDFVGRELNGKRFSMNLLIPTGSATLCQSLVVTYSEVGPILREVIEASRRADVEFMWYSPTPMCLFNPVAHQLGNKGCSACDGLISVAANGDVLPCSSYDESVGNLLQDNVRSIWFSPKAKWFRDKAFAREACRDCECFQICQGACPLYWRQMDFTELDLS